MAHSFAFFANEWGYDAACVTCSAPSYSHPLVGRQVERATSLNAQGGQVRAIPRFERRKTWGTRLSAYPTQSQTARLNGAPVLRSRKTINFPSRHIPKGHRLCYGPACTNYCFSTLKSLDLENDASV